MHLVDGHWRVWRLALAPLAQPVRVTPDVAVQVPHARGGAGAQLGGEGEGIGLEHAMALIPREDGVFIQRARLYARQEQLPDTAGAQPHRVGALVPAVEVTD